MEFSDVISFINEIIPETTDNKYDGIVVKKLEASNTLDEGRTTKQTHIAITGNQMDVFPYLQADGYFNCGYGEKDDSLKKYFIEQVPFRIHRTNVESLALEATNEFEFNSDNYVRSMVSIVRSRRDGAADQVQLSLTTYDDKSFIAFRKIVHAGDFLIILKFRERLEYDCYAVKSNMQGSEKLAELNNRFYKLADYTKAKVDDFIIIKDEEELKSEYSFVELASILKSMYENAPKNMQTTSIHAFGIKYGKAIIEGNYVAKDLAIAAGISENYQAEISKGVRLYNSFADNLFGMTMWGNEGRYISEPEGIRCTGGENILLYGVPGSGKSHYIKKNYCSDKKYIQRVVFHPDYTYSDFVGQILPRVENGQLKYVFTPGPFTKILKEAWWDPTNHYYLIIEEINRGNAPAIFGEIFQLLDRKSSDSYPGEEVGESEYDIVNFDIANEVYGDKSRPVFLPSNLTVLATMNTSDQNVFTLDTAFQRRWIMKHIENKVETAKHSDVIIDGTNINWSVFAKVTNDLVLSVNRDAGSSEDKRLGAYFAGPRELESDRFPEKVLKYLWDDAFRMDRIAYFSDGAKSLEFVIETFATSKKDPLSLVLRPEVYNKMVALMNESETKEDSEDSGDN